MIILEVSNGADDGLLVSLMVLIRRHYLSHGDATPVYPRSSQPGDLLTSRFRQIQLGSISRGPGESVGSTGDKVPAYLNSHDW